MIAYIQGTLTYINDQSVVVETMGVGYEIVCPNPFVFQHQLNEQVKIVTFHHVREDAQILFGFKNEEEKRLFTKLISVSGIGPKSALAILANVHIADFAAAVEREDDKFLTGFPGVGKKTARQIILDLKGKLGSIFTLEAVGNISQEDAGEDTANQTVSEAVEALKALGYTDKELNPVAAELRKEGAADADKLIHKALRMLAK
ncbi:Holliday junction branch migration protein RuvA [Virgibacillus halophilus]|uniref:Holliday junction branch migration complex subunit RuvA n=1 Tax=Tigheibacillus halophilus TaxID=361280 RepID=A0ABU5CBZ7_9BACI|nr:Holliday junction branch migration protein RuvA [Virgibacillus halophilus]